MFVCLGVELLPWSQLSNTRSHVQLNLILFHTCKGPLFLRKQPLIQIYTHAQYYNVMPIPVFPLAVVAVHLTQLLEVQMASRKLQ